MANGPDSIDVNAIRWTGAGANKQQETAKRGLDIKESETTLPYKGPQAAATLERTEQDLKLSRERQVDEMRQRHEANPDYKRYSVAIPALAQALHTSADPTGDIALTYAAAKIFDPDSAVREAEQEALGNTVNLLDKTAQRLRKEFGMTEGGTFTREARARLRREIALKAKALNGAYNRVRLQDQRIARERGYEPYQIIGEHLGTPQMDALKSYDEAVARAAKPKPNDVASQRGAQPAGLDSGRVSGEDIKGFRFNPEVENELSSFLRNPGFTPEGYGRLVAQRMLDAGRITPEQLAQTAESTAAGVKEYAALSDEDRAKLPVPALDYSQVDKAATESAGLGASVAQGLRNLPESTVGMAQGLLALPVDATVSLLTGERYGSFKSFTDLAAALVQGNTDDPAVQAAADALKERYGSLDALKRTAITDPVGAVGDLSLVLTGGGSAIAKLPGAAGAVGQKLATVGRVLDPLSAGVGATTEGVPAAYAAAKSRAPGALEGIQNAPSHIAGFPSGVGGETIREAAGAGFERGAAGAPTARSEAFTTGMRRPGENAADLVQTAHEAVANLRQAASRRYQDAMAQFGRNPVPLDLDVVRKRMLAIKPRNFDAMVDAPKRPSDHLAWQQMNDSVEHYAAQASQDPSLLEPMAMDAFKQDLYDIGSKIGGAYDRDAARIAGTAYKAVRQELVKHDPLYADAMRDYERAATEARELEDTFSLAQARGKPLKVDTAARKLQSIMRNNANTGYGLRAQQGQRLADLDPTGTLMAGVAGQSASAPFARGIRSGVAAGGGVPTAGIAAVAAPPTLAASIPLLAATSPRLAGEAAYGVGRLAGTAVRGGQALAQSPAGRYTAGAARGLADLYERYPTAFLASAQAGSRGRDLADKYDLSQIGLIPPEEEDGY